MSDTLQVVVDRAECISCGACWDDCPAVFEESSDGLTEVAAAYRISEDRARGLVPAGLEACVLTAAEGCPVEIIHVAAAS